MLTATQAEIVVVTSGPGGMTIQTNPWTTLAQSRRYEDRYVAVDVDQVEHKSGRKHPHTALRFKVYGIAVLPIDSDGYVYLVGQYRYVLEKFTWETIRGSDPLDLSPLATAQRELSEETGFVAASWLEVLRLDASPGITSEQAPCFVAWNIRQGSDHPEMQESLDLKRLPFAEAVRWVLSGRITDAASAALLLALDARARHGDLPEDLINLMGA